MHIIDELKFVANSGNFIRGANDGIYKRGKDYFVTFVHGGEDGFMSIQVNQFIRLNTSPYMLRNQIHKYLGVDIPKDARVFINPCHSEACMRKWKKSSKKYKVFIFSGKSSELTSFVFANDKGERTPIRYIPNKRKKYMMLVFDYSNDSERLLISNSSELKKVFENHLDSRVRVNHKKN